MNSRPGAFFRLGAGVAGTSPRSSSSGFQQDWGAYAAKGVRIGFASFSVRNTAVLNIYSQLGARFTSAEGVWLWHPGQDQVYSRN